MICKAEESREKGLGHNQAWRIEDRRNTIEISRGVNRKNRPEMDGFFVLGEYHNCDRKQSELNSFLLHYV